MDTTEIKGREGQRLNEALGAQLEEASASHQYLGSTAFPIPLHIDTKDSTTDKDSSRPRWSTGDGEFKAPNKAGENAQQLIWNENVAFADATAASVRPDAPVVGTATRILAAGGPQ
jgi:hypothetical protein